jgi:hypothetical protein
MARGGGGLDPVGMAFTPNMSQRDLVKLALLVCSERGSAKHRPAAKGIWAPAPGPDSR